MTYLVLYLLASLVVGSTMLTAVRGHRRAKRLRAQAQWERDRLAAWEENNRAFMEVCDKLKQDGTP